MRSSNPVLTRLTPETHTQQAGYGAGYGSPYQPTRTPSPVVGAEDRMTLDDVVVKTVGMLAILAAAAAATAFVVPHEYIVPAWVVSGIIGFVLVLVITLKRVISPPLFIAYAIIEGVFVGAISKAYASVFDGIVVQAALGTFGIFFVMAALYRARIIRSSPKFARGVIGALFGVLALIIGNLILSLFGVNLGLRDGSPLAIIFSLVIIVIGALTFVLDFDLVEQSLAAGAPKNMAWMCALGMVVGLVFVYVEVLRLLSYLRER